MSALEGGELEGSDWVRRFGVYLHRRRLEVLRKLIGPGRSESALDIGCGEGCLAIVGVRNAVGIDVNREKGVGVYGSAENLPFRGHAFDLVFAGEILEHLESPLKAVTDWVRVLKPNGTIIISTPNGTLVKAVGGHPGHKGTYAPSEVRSVLNNIGLHVVSVTGIFTGLVSGRRLFRRIPFEWMKMAVLRLPFPLSLSYDVFYKARKG